MPSKRTIIFRRQKRASPKQHSKDRLENSKYIWQQNAQRKAKKQNTQNRLTVQKQIALTSKI